MFRIFIKVDVRDYQVFRAQYDKGVELRREWGIVGGGVYRGVEKPNEITVCHDFLTLEEAKAFQRRDQLRDAMAEASVTHAPLMWLTEPT